ncbi:hypothetical protein CYLTODRAFT_397665 [Cylindrobasidium torrendii FP15055 ss-10]|uniref:peptidylprolyl isomerase n=1 Tax=Cylindrobasidium torrendii FP15055 ss-10 TaxID=1314674 RepID=A0A0D7B9G5_9AGAR|nr:hypothetical protein CYLTODRAFT_397665 [Cylindrobasidium torrendii FP15055 ss-10]
MSTSVGIWSLKVEPSKEGVELMLDTDLRITNVALGDDDETPNKTGRTTVKLIYQTLTYDIDSDEEEQEDEDSEDGGEPRLTEPKTTFLGSLTCGKVENSTVDIFLPEEGLYTIIVSGENPVYLTGTMIQQRPPPGYDDSDSESEDEFDLGDIPSDAEVDTMEDDSHRFEEIEDGKPVNGKRAREEVEVDETKLSKAEKKKAKKRKGEDGQAVAAEPAAEKKKEKAEEKPKKEAPETKELAMGVKAKDTTVGKGPTAKKGKRVEMRYIGKLTNGKVFDSNTKGKPFVFQLGAGEVIKGWDIGVAGMAVGGERILTIPPAAGYGKKGSGPIPANSTLIFEVKLLGVK